MTYVFCERFFPPYGDRTVDQMKQAARSGKQNIVEGIEAGITSQETELKLLNVARASLEELREDYLDYLKSRHLMLWTPAHPRFRKMLDFCQVHNIVTDYEPYFEVWSDEEFCNTALTLCHMTDTLMCRFMSYLEERFVREGGFKERMYAARKGYCRDQEAQIAALETELDELRRALRDRQHSKGEGEETADS